MRRMSISLGAVVSCQFSIIGGNEGTSQGKEWLEIVVVESRMFEGFSRLAGQCPFVLV
jgi:hypothetical protein